MEISSARNGLECSTQKWWNDFSSEKYAGDAMMFHNGGFELMKRVKIEQNLLFLEKFSKIFLFPFFDLEIGRKIQR